MAKEIVDVRKAILNDNANVSIRFEDICEWAGTIYKVDMSKKVQISVLKRKIEESGNKIFERLHIFVKRFI